MVAVDMTHVLEQTRLDFSQVSSPGCLFFMTPLGMCVWLFRDAEPMGAVKPQFGFQPTCSSVATEYCIRKIFNGGERIPLLWYEQCILESPNLLPLLTLSNTVLCYQRLNTDFCQTGLSPTFFCWLQERQSGFVPLIESFKAVMTSHFQSHYI